VSPLQLDLSRYTAAVGERSALRFQGRVAQVIGLSIEVEGLPLAVGEVCTIHPQGSSSWISAEVVGFRDQRLIVMPFSETHGVRPGSPVLARGRGFHVPVGPALLGRVVNGLAEPIDGLGPLGTSERYSVANQPPDPLTRRPIREALGTGIRAIDGLITCGLGQRIGIFAGSGVGKSTTLGMIARGARTDVNVIALIGERGREVQEFIEKDLGPEGLRRSVVVVSTSDQPALQRMKAAWVATAMAEYFRDHGLQVTLMMDSVTRWAMAQREIGLTVGEPPVVKGYPPSVFALMPKLMERAGSAERGTITGFYTVLVEGDDVNEPIADTARSILDGHIWLSRKLAHENHYPAIDVLGSISRLMSSVADPSHRRAAAALRDALAVYQSSEDLINIGAYVSGTNPTLDRAIAALPAVREFLCQSSDEATPYEQSVAALQQLFAE
jgi:flagellum-specific ATP synthase